MSASIVAVGAGRMGRGIAMAYAIRGQRVTVVDFKPREASQFQALHHDIDQELNTALRQLADLDLFEAAQIDVIRQRIQVVDLAHAGQALETAGIIYEGVPETLDAKRDALNPAYVIPLVEISAHDQTSPQALAALKESLTGIGKVPVQCACSPGFIVPRLQTLIMNEAARMVEEGVATVEEIDRATRYGLGFRFASIGVLEFIDYGGNDILYHASHYLSDNLDSTRYAAPDIIKRYMHEGKIGLRSASGFLSYEGVDLHAYRRDVLARTLGMLRHCGLDQSIPSTTVKEISDEN